MPTVRRRQARTEGPKDNWKVENASEENELKRLSRALNQDVRAIESRRKLGRHPKERPTLNYKNR